MVKTTAEVPCMGAGMEGLLARVEQEENQVTDL